MSTVYQTILLEKEQGITRIVVNRPNVLNAMNRECLVEMKDALQKAKRDRETSIVVITGSGERMFSVGADIKDLANLVRTRDRSGIQRFSKLFEDIFRTIESMGKITVAAVNGPAIGAGADLALSSDIRLLCQDAYFSYPEIRIGLVPPTFRLRAFIGKSLAKQFALSGHKLTAARACQMGLALEVFESDDFQQEVSKAVRSMSGIDCEIIRTVKTAIRKGVGSDPAYHSPERFFSEKFRIVLKDFLARSGRD